MQSSVTGTLRYPHQCGLNLFLYEIEWRSKPFSEHVTITSVRLVKSETFMLDDNDRASMPCMMTLEYAKKSKESIAAGQWFKDALESHSGIWQDIAHAINSTIIHEALGIAYARRDSYFASLGEGGAA